MNFRGHKTNSLNACNLVGSQLILHSFPFDTKDDWDTEKFLNCCLPCLEDQTSQYRIMHYRPKFERSDRRMKWLLYQ